MSTTMESIESLTSDHREELFILGAGFSKSISENMPLMSELTESLKHRMERNSHPGAVIPVHRIETVLIPTYAATVNADGEMTRYRRW